MVNLDEAMKGICQVNTKSVKRVAILLFIVTSLFVTSCKYVEKVFPQITPEEAEEVKNICINLKPHPSFVKTHESYGVKSNSAGCSIQYSSTASAEDVDEYYVNLLTPLGWRYHKDSNILRFKKGRYAINITNDNFSFVTNKIYLVDCTVGIL